MKAKFGAIVVDGRGKIGGHVASKNRAGSYFRTKVTPVNKNTASQATVRSRLAGISQSWRSLTNVQRAAWNAAVQDFKKTNIFGDLLSPSGFNLYQRLNNNIAAVGGAALVTPPLPVGVDYFSNLSVAAVSGTGAVTVTFSPAIPAGTAVKLFATAPMSAGKSYIKTEFRIIDVLTNTDVSPFTATTVYAAKFGAPSEAGQKIAIKAVFVDTATGVEGIACQAVAIVS